MSSTAESTEVETTRASDVAPESWTVEDAAALYRVAEWGDRFFLVSESGHAAVRVGREHGDQVIDIQAVVEDLRARNVSFPCLLRFHDVLRARVERVNAAFANAIEEAEYPGRYQGVYPIKVNQLHEVVEEVLDAGRPFRMGLECGSKTELVATLPHLEDDETLLICNGVKDRVMLSLILAGQQLGKRVIPVMEKFSEAERYLALAAELGQAPRLGVRVRLDTEGAGRWAESGSHQSKFGLSIPELVALSARLRDAGQLEAIELLHFHIGSQVEDVNVVKRAAREIAHVYAQLVQRGARIGFIDVGGGLGVNYDAGYSDEEGGVNYSLQEYANAVVFAVKEVCDAQEVPAPTLVSESGRAITAHHSVLIVEVLETHGKGQIDPGWTLDEDDHQCIAELSAALDWARELPAESKPTSLLEVFHDAQEGKKQADALFGYGYLSIEDKALAEQLYWSVCRAVQSRAENLDPAELPAELRDLGDQVVDQYLCNFSVFQSILDHWAIGQRFPIMPIDHLDERPTRRAVLVDLTCDSDGKVGRYVSGAPEKDYLPLHAPGDGERYFLGFFLMGAYQDIMGDAHNLFGRVPEAHIYADEGEPGGYYVEKIIEGTSIQDMLAQVQYFPSDLKRRMSELIRRKTEAGVLRPRAGVELLERYMACFPSGTYLEPTAGDPTLARG